MCPVDSPIMLNETKDWTNPLQRTAVAPYCIGPLEVQEDL